MVTCAKCKRGGGSLLKKLLRISILKKKITILWQQRVKADMEARAPAAGSVPMKLALLPGLNPNSVPYWPCYLE